MPAFRDPGKVISDVVFTRLLDRRIVVLGSRIDDETATWVIAQLILLGSEDPAADIKLYIDSPGGTLGAGLAIHDAMNFVPCDVSTWAVGQVGSVSQFILSSGARGKRYAVPTSLISLDCSSDLQGHPDVFASERLLVEIARLTSRQTGQPAEQVANDLQSGLTLTAIEARGYGLVDAIVHEVAGGPHSN